LATDCAIDAGERAALAGRLQLVRSEMAQAARQAGRQPSDITLVGVSKFVAPEKVCAAVDLGLSDLGENRVQELLEKSAYLEAAGRKPRWHMIGSLQRNKVKYIVGRTELIHSVDSLELLTELGRHSVRRGLVSDILFEINVSGEATKHGFDGGELERAIALAAATPGVRLRGLMTMAPLVSDPELTRPVFARAHELFVRLAVQTADPAVFQILSMGMSQDYPQAISCGATHVRIGTAIFGPRM
jgi:PLP dependent protein